MDLAQTLTAAETMTARFALGTSRVADTRIDIILRREDLLTAVRAFVDAHWGYLATITGLDIPSAWPAAAPACEPADQGGPLEDRLEALYHFVNGAAVATLRVTVPYSDPRIPSICPVIPAATLYERELQEMFGFVVEGTPDTARLLLPDDWPDGVHPLRKSFTGLPTATEG